MQAADAKQGALVRAIGGKRTSLSAVRTSQSALADQGSKDAEVEMSQMGAKDELEVNGEVKATPDLQKADVDMVILSLI